MRLYPVTILAFALLPVCTHASETKSSLFFKPNEIAQIEHAVRAAQPLLLSQTRHVLHCGSIIYIDEDNWSVWLQGEKWTPETDKPNLHIIEVAENEVRISVQIAGNDGYKEITIKPNQSLNLLTGELFDGIY